MISPTFIQELFAGNIQGKFPFGNGNAKQGGQAQSGFSAIFSRRMVESTNGSDGTAFGTAPLRGHRFLDQLKKTIMASGISLEASRVDAEAMAEFRKLLVKAGFSRQEVMEMMSEASTGDTGKGVTLATLFARASQLSKPDEAGDAAVLLEISALPYLESMLGQLGMDGQSIQSVLADAKMEGIGIDIEKLAASIRRVMAADKRQAQNVSGGTDDILDMMRRIGLLENDKKSLAATLDKMIFELSRLNKKNTASAQEEGGADEVSGALLVSYLQQLVAILGDEGENLQQMIGSAGNDGEALLAKLVRMRQELSVSPIVTGMTGLSVTPGETRKPGKMNLSQFVSALEAKISSERHVHGVLKGEASGQPVARAVGKFLERISTDSARAKNKLTAPTGINQLQGKQGAIQDGRPAVEKSIPGATEKEGQGQIVLEATRQASQRGDTDLNSFENASGKNETAKFMEALATAGKDKVKKRVDQKLSAVDGFVKALKSADEVTASVKMPGHKSLPGYLLDQVSRQIMKLRAVGENEITLQLKPPHLGRMKLNIEHTSGGIKVGIVVESATAKEMLLSHTSDLKTALGDQGLRLDKIDVETQSNFDRSMAQAGREFGQSGGHSGRRNGRGLQSGGLVPEVLVLPETVRAVNSGRLDLMA